MINANLHIQIVGNAGQHGKNVRFLVITREPLRLAHLATTRCIYPQDALSFLQAELNALSAQKWADKLGVSASMMTRVKQAARQLPGSGGIPPSQPLQYRVVGKGRRVVLVVTQNPIEFSPLSQTEGNMLLEAGMEAQFCDWASLANLAAVARQLGVSRIFLVNAWKLVEKSLT